MATLMEDLGLYLAAQGRGVIGETLWMNYMPQDPDTIVVVSEYSAGSPIDTMGRDHIPFVERPRVQVMARSSNEDYLFARSVADACYRDLCAVVELALVSGSSVYTFTPQDTPVLAGRDDQRRVLVSCNFEVTRYPEETSIYTPSPVDPSGSSSYTHFQLSPSSTWTINHNLGYTPVIEMFTVGGLLLAGSVSNPNNNQTVVTFDNPVAGTARLV